MGIILNHSVIHYFDGWQAQRNSRLHRQREALLELQVTRWEISVSQFPKSMGVAMLGDISTSDYNRLHQFHRSSNIFHIIFKSLTLWLETLILDVFLDVFRMCFDHVSF